MMNEANLSLGEFLRQEREKRGMTIEQVASATKIGVKQLHALESDQYVELPAKPFVRGFVTSYARFIGLDAREVLTRFNDFIESRSHDRPNREAGHSGYAFERREGEQSRTILGIVMAVLVVLGLVVVALKPNVRHRRGGNVEKLRAAHGPAASPSPSFSSEPLAQLLGVAPSGRTVPLLASPAPAPTPSQTLRIPIPTPTQSAVAKPSPSPVATPVPSVVPSVALSPLVAPSPSPTPDPLNTGIGLKPSQIKHKIIFKAAESVWVRYQSDERPVMQFVLKRDKILVIRAESKIIVQIATPSAVTFNYNGQGYKPMTQSKNTLLRQGDPTLYLPMQLSETIQEPFPGQKPLSSRPRPFSPEPTPSVSPTP